MIRVVNHAQVAGRQVELQQRVGMWLASVDRSVHARLHVSCLARMRVSQNTRFRGDVIVRPTRLARAKNGYPYKARCCREVQSR